MRKPYYLYPETLIPARHPYKSLTGTRIDPLQEPFIDPLKGTKLRSITLRVHVPKQYTLWPQSTYIGTTLRPKYILFGYMDP